MSEAERLIVLFAPDARFDGAWRFAERRLTVEWVETRAIGRFDPAGLAVSADDRPAQVG